MDYRLYCWRFCRLRFRRKLAGRSGRRALMSQVKSERILPNSSPDLVPDTPGLRSMLSTAEWSQRQSRLPDYAAENQALIALTQSMAASPEGILQELVETA